MELGNKEDNFMEKYHDDKNYSLNEVMNKDYYKNNPEKIAIYHFAGNTFTRPWFENSKHPLKKIYDKYYYASPWANKKQKRFKIIPEDEIQFLCYRILPQSINAVVASIMQTIFMKIQYKL